MFYVVDYSKYGSCTVLDTIDNSVEEVDFEDLKHEWGTLKDRFVGNFYGMNNEVFLKPFDVFDIDNLNKQPIITYLLSSLGITGSLSYNSNLLDLKPFWLDYKNRYISSSFLVNLEYYFSIDYQLIKDFYNFLISDKDIIVYSSSTPRNFLILCFSYYREKLYKTCDSDALFLKKFNVRLDETEEYYVVFFDNDLEAKFIYFANLLFQEFNDICVGVNKLYSRSIINPVCISNMERVVGKLTVHSCYKNCVAYKAERKIPLYDVSKRLLLKD